jgi:hypothetical protein
MCDDVPEVTEGRRLRVQFPIQEQLLCSIVKRFRGGLVFKAHGLLHHLTVMKKRRRDGVRRAEGRSFEPP